MSANLPAQEAAHIAPRPFFRTPVTEAPLIKFTLIAIGLAFIVAMIFLPLAAVFFEAFRRGAEPFFAALVEPDALSAIRLTLFVAAISV